MPGPHPADDDVPPTTTASRCAVVDLTRRRGGHSRHMSGHRPPTPDGPGRLAETAEAIALRDGCSLTDPDVAAGYTVCLQLMGHVIDGALATGALNLEGHTTLTMVIRDASAVPGLLAPPAPTHGTC